MNRAIGILFPNLHEERLGDLVQQRCMGSLPIGGRYRLIDFALSGLSNAGIDHVTVIAQNNCQALPDHLGNGREWDLARKRGGLVLLPLTALSAHRRTDVLEGICSAIGNSSAADVVLAGCAEMANVDVAALLHAHRTSGADATLLYRRQCFESRVPPGITTLALDDFGRVRALRCNPAASGEQNVWMHILVIRREVLDWAVRDCLSRGLGSFEQDVLQGCLPRFCFFSQEFSGYAVRPDCRKSYYDANLALLRPEVRAALFPPERPIYTRVRDDAPVRYGLHAHVSNSLIADGCIIEGEVQDSLLFRGVTVGRGAQVRGCVLMQGTQVGERAALDCVIADKGVCVSADRRIVGVCTYPSYLARNAVI